MSAMLSSIAGDGFRCGSLLHWSRSIMHWFKGAQAVDLGFALILTALILVVVSTISLRRARKLARIQEEQFRQRTATVRRRLAEVLGRQQPL